MPRPIRPGSNAGLVVAAVTSAVALVLTTAGMPRAWGSASASATRGATFATAATAAPTPPPVLLPNMRSVQASELRIEMQRGIRWLRFTSQLANTGRGPVEVRPNDAGNCPKNKRHATQILYRDVNRNGHFDRRADTVVARRSAGCMIFHPTHHHWHFEAAARYTLWNPRAE